MRACTCLCLSLASDFSEVIIIKLDRVTASDMIMYLVLIIWTLTLIQGSHRSSSWKSERFDYYQKLFKQSPVMSPWWSFCTLYLSHARWSYRRRLGSLLFCACSMCDINCSNAITSHCLLIQTIPIKFTVKIVRLKVYLIFSQSDDLALYSRSQQRLNRDKC